MGKCVARTEAKAKATLKRPAAAKAKAKGKAKSQPARLKPEDFKVRTAWPRGCYTLVRGHFRLRTFDFACRGVVNTFWDKSRKLEKTGCPDERPASMREVFELKLKAGPCEEFMADAVITSCKFRGYQPVRNLPVHTWG